MNRSLIYTVVLVLASSFSAANAQFADFGSQLTDVPTWTTTVFGSALTAQFTTSFTPGTGDILWRPATTVFDAPAFVQRFGTSAPTIQMFTLANQATSATRVDFTIDNPFPANARLIVMDMDGIGERVTVSSLSGAIAEPVRYETLNPNTSSHGDSSFPTWNPSIQQLHSTATKQNDREAAVFDIGGKTQFAVTLAAGEAASSWYAITTDPVPEPASLSLVMTGLLSLGLLRRKG